MKLPEDYSSTIVYLNRFSSTKPGDPDQFVFTDRDKDASAHALDSETVFNVVKPEVRTKTGGKIELASVAYQSIELNKPTARAMDESMPIVRDSMLLREVATQTGQPKEIGGKLFRGLLEDLDMVSRYAGPKFTRALMDVAERYVSTDVDEGTTGANQMGPAQIECLFEDETRVGEAVLQVLQAPQSDVERARKELAKALKETKLEAGTEGGAQAMRERFAESIVRLRNDVLLAGNEHDPSMRKILESGRSNSPGERDKNLWFHNFSEHEDAIDLGDNLPGPPPGASFPEHYQQYMERVENIHRFARSPVLHSYVAMWLFSKYKEYGDSRQFNETAKKAFKMGVQGAAERILGESEADRAKRKDTTANAAEKGIEKLPTTSSNDAGKPDAGMEQLKKRMARQMVQASMAVFEIEKTFQRRSLQELLEEFFIEAASATSGALKAVLDESKGFVKQYATMYRNLLSLVGDANMLSSPKTLAKNVNELSVPGNEDGMDEVAKKSQEVLSDKNPPVKKPTDVGADSKVAKTYRSYVRDSIMNTFAEQVGKHSVINFGKKFDQKSGEIKTDVEGLRANYRGDRKLNRAVEEVTEACAGAVLPSAAASRKILTDTASEAIAADIKANSPGNMKQFKVPEAIREKMQSEGASRKMTGPITVKENKIADLKIDGNTAQVVIDLESKVFEKNNPEFRIADPSTDVKLDSKQFAGFDMNQIDEKGDIRDFIARAAHDRPLSKEEARKQVAQFPDYAEKCESMRALYCGEGASDIDQATIDDFKRAIRALRFGECIQAARDAESRLGLRDISKTILLMLLLVRHIGDLDNTEQANAKPDPATTKMLGSGMKTLFNLSIFYPVADGDGWKTISNSMVYYKTMCESVQKVQDHLADVADLMAIADALPPAAKLVVINNSVDEYLKNMKSASKFVFQKHKPSVMLIGRGAGGGPGQSWRPLYNEFKKKFEGVTPGDGVQLCCPVLIAHDKMDASCTIPVADLSAMKHIRFVPAKTLRPKQEPSNAPGETGRTHTIELEVEHARSLPSFPAAMAVALMADEGVFGKLPDREIDGWLSDAVEAATGTGGFQRGDTGESVDTRLKRCWMESTSCNALEALITARMATLALKARGEGLQSYNTFHTNHIAPEGDDEHPALEGLERMINNDRKSMRLFVERTTAEFEKQAGMQFFSIKNGIRIEIDGVKKATGHDAVKIPFNMRQGFKFTGV